DSALVAVTAGTGAVAVMQIGRSVQRGRNVNEVLLTICKNFVGYDRKIGGDHETKIALRNCVSCESAFHYMLNHWEIQHRLAALKLDLDVWRRRSEYEV